MKLDFKAPKIHIKCLARRLAKMRPLKEGEIAKMLKPNLATLDASNVLKFLRLSLHIKWRAVCILLIPFRTVFSPATTKYAQVLRTTLFYSFWLFYHLQGIDRILLAFMFSLVSHPRAKKSRAKRVFCANWNKKANVN